MFLLVFPKITCDNISIVIILVYFLALYNCKVNILWPQYQTFDVEPDQYSNLGANADINIPLLIFLYPHILFQKMSPLCHNCKQL